MPRQIANRNVALRYICFWGWTRLRFSSMVEGILSSLGCGSQPSASILLYFTTIFIHVWGYSLKFLGRPAVMLRFFCVKKFELFISWWWWVVAFVMVYGVKWLVRYVEESKVWFWPLFCVSWALSVLHTFLGIFFFNQKLSPQSRRQTMEWIKWSKRNNPQCIYMSVIALN